MSPGRSHLIRLIIKLRAAGDVCGCPGHMAQTGRSVGGEKATGGNVGVKKRKNISLGESKI